MRRLVEALSREFFCIEPIKIGDILGREHNSPFKEKVANLISKCPAGTIPEGVSLHNVVEIDMSRYFNTIDKISGARIEVMTRGEIMLNFAEKLPYRQPLYVDVKESKLTWKYSPYQVGYINSQGDENGYYKAKINFERMI